MIGRAPWLPLFFAVAACSWMPHWACHYYRLETGTSFVVGGWEFSVRESALSMIVYSVLIGLNLASIAAVRLRFGSALVSGLGHLAIGSIHVLRLVRPFRFEVFGSPWPLAASAREAAIVTGFGVLCLFVAWRSRRAITTGGTR